MPNIYVDLAISLKYLTTYADAWGLGFLFMGKKKKKKRAQSCDLHMGLHTACGV